MHLPNADKFVIYIEHTPAVRDLVIEQVSLWQLWLGVHTHVVEAEDFEDDREPGFGSDPNHAICISATEMTAELSGVRDFIQDSQECLLLLQLFGGLCRMLDGRIRARAALSSIVKIHSPQAKPLSDKDMAIFLRIPPDKMMDIMKSYIEKHPEPAKLHDVAVSLAKALQES